MSDVPKSLLDMMEGDAERHQPKLPEQKPTESITTILDQREEPLAPVVVREYPVNGTPEDHQHRALNESYMKEGQCWWVDPGGGKTFLTIADASLLYQKDLIDAALVLAPNGPHEQWIDEQVPKWCGVPWRGVHNKQSKGTIDKFFQYRPRKLAWAAINYESLAYPAGRAFVEKFVSMYPRFMLVVDESQKCKDPKAKRTQEMMLLALKAAYRRILSGTPLLKGLEDLWSQYEACERGSVWEHELYREKRRGRGVTLDGFYGYRSHYCVTKDVRTKEQKRRGIPERTAIVGYRNQNELLSRTRRIATRIMSNEFQKTEESKFITVRTPMNDNQEREYKRMQEHLLSLIDGRSITAQNALVQLGKLQQIAAGFMYDENKNALDLSNRKIDAALDLLEMLNEPVIVWSHFGHTQHQLATQIEEKLERHVYLKNEVEEWKKDPIGVLVGNQTSGLGVGMNLQHAAANIYVTNSYSAEARWQSLKRTDRMGQTRQVRNWDLITPNTVEGKVMQALQDKEDLSRASIDRLRGMLL